MPHGVPKCPECVTWRLVISDGPQGQSIICMQLLSASATVAAAALLKGVHLSELSQGFPSIGDIQSTVPVPKEKWFEYAGERSGRFQVCMFCQPAMLHVQSILCQTPSVAWVVHVMNTQQIRVRREANRGCRWVTIRSSHGLCQVLVLALSSMQLYRKSGWMKHCRATTTKMALQRQSAAYMLLGKMKHLA